MILFFTSKSSKGEPHFHIEVNQSLKFLFPCIFAQEIKYHKTYKMPIEICKKKNPTPGANKNYSTAKVRKAATKASLMKVSPSKMNPNKAPEDDNTHPMPYTYPRKFPDDTCHDCR
jgi:hypothetical protein